MEQLLSINHPKEKTNPYGSAGKLNTAALGYRPPVWKRTTTIRWLVVLVSLYDITKG